MTGLGSWASGRGRDGGLSVGESCVDETCSRAKALSTRYLELRRLQMILQERAPLSHSPLELWVLEAKFEKLGFRKPKMI